MVLIRKRITSIDLKTSIFYYYNIFLVILCLFEVLKNSIPIVNS